MVVGHLLTVMDWPHLPIWMFSFNSVNLLCFGIEGIRLYYSVDLRASKQHLSFLQVRA